MEHPIKKFKLTATFQCAAFNKQQLPPDNGIECVVLGRSNTGKSSLLNSVFSNNTLMKVSKTPGRTQSLNFLTINDLNDKKIIDLPGLGYAKVSKQTKSDFYNSTVDFIGTRQAVFGFIYLIDCRFPPKEIDLEILHWLTTKHWQILIVFSKADKISKSKMKLAINQFKTQFNFNCLPYSIKNPEAIKGLRLWLAEFFSLV